MSKTIVFGASGQDGSYMIESLLRKGHHVWGVIRRNSTNSMGNIQKWVINSPRFTLVEGDITDISFLQDLFIRVLPDEIYNLAAQSHVGTSFRMPMYTIEVTGIGAINIMNTMRAICPDARMYQASSSEMYGNANKLDFPLEENTPLRPVSPYAVAKTMAHEMAQIYRKEGLYIACGICHNHESPRRGELFLTSKVIKAAAAKKVVQLGNLDAIRDWGYAPEYVEGMILTLQRDEPDDYVFCTGEGYTVGKFVELAYRAAGLNPNDYVQANTPEFMRPLDVPALWGDPTRTRNLLGWEATTEIRGLIDKMLYAEITKQESL